MVRPQVEQSCPFLTLAQIGRRSVVKVSLMVSSRQGTKARKPIPARLASSTVKKFPPFFAREKDQPSLVVYIFTRDPPQILPAAAGRRKLLGMSSVILQRRICGSSLAADRPLIDGGT